MFLTEFTIDGFPLWIVLLICLGVFVAGFIDAIAGGGGIISVPTYMMAFGNLPTYYVMGTNKCSSCIGTCTAMLRYIKNGCVNWKLALPAVAFAMVGAMGGTWLQHHTPDVILKYFLVLVLPVIAFFTLRNRDWPEEAGIIEFKKQIFIICIASLVIGVYDGYYGPGTGSFLLLVFVRMAKMDVRTASGNVKVVNAASNIAGLYGAFRGGYVLLGVGLCAAVASLLGNYLGSGLAIKNGAKIVRPTVIFVLVLLTIKVLGELIFH